MTKKQKSVLGKGLNAMLGGETLSTLRHTDSPSALEGGHTIGKLPLDKIYPNPNQPRTHFDQESLTDLANSIKHLGLIQPITVRPDGKGAYLIISGERRYRACKLLNISHVPVYIRDVVAEEVLELALVENIQREDLNAIEVALAYQHLSEQTGATHEEIARRVGKKRSSISNYLRLLKLPAEIQLGLSEQALDMGHARALLQIDDAERQMELYQLILNEGLSVREVEELARAIKTNHTPIDKPTQKKKDSNTAYLALEKQLSKAFGVKVRFSHNEKGRGSINIPFTSEEEMERLISLLQRIQD